ncbi:MAG: hypothetical protein AAGG68_21050 [Bacteroidota bacterium]
MKSKIEVKKVAQLTGHNGGIYALEATSNPRFSLSGAGDGWIVKWDLDEPELGKLLAKVETQIFSLKFLEKLDLIVVGNMNGGVHWVNLKHPEKTLNIAHHRKGVFGIEQIDNHVFTIGGEGILTKWSIEEKRTLESLQLSYESLRSIQYIEARRELIIGASDGNIYFVDAQNLSVKHTITKAHDNSVFALHYHPEKQQLFSSGRDAHLKVWQLNSTYDCLSSQAAHLFTINDIAFHPSKPIFASASRDKTIKIWNVNTFQLLKVIETIRDDGHLNSVNALHWSTHNNYLLSASDDRTIGIWQITTLN